MFLIAFLIFLWIAVTVSVAILGLLFVLLFPRAADATAAAGRRFWPTLGWGALIGIVGPILGVLVLVTIVGIPFGLGILSALNVLAPLGYVASSLILGRLMVKGTSTGCAHRRVLRRVRDPARRRAHPRHRLHRVVPGLHLRARRARPGGLARRATGSRVPGHRATGRSTADAGRHGARGHWRASRVTRVRSPDCAPARLT